MTCVPSVKGSNLNQDETDFNRCVAHVRACNEHTIGILKGCWTSLQRLPVRIRPGHEDADLTWAIDWIHVCVILHNFLLEEDDDFPEQAWHQEEVHIPSGNPWYENKEVELAAGQEFRHSVMEDVLEAGHGPRGVISWTKRKRQ